MNETPYDELVDKLYGEMGLPPMKATSILDKIDALTAKRTLALKKIRDSAHRDFCRADHTYIKYHNEAWVAARDEVLEELNE